MQTVLTQLNGVPGVVGTLLCDAEGQLLAQQFPPLFDVPLLQEAATALADSAIGLETITGPAGLMDFRYGDARVVVKPFDGARLLMLCAKNVNLQLLLISTSVAVTKLARLVREGAQARAAAAPPLPAKPAAAPAPAAPEPQKPAKPKMPKWTPSL